MAWPADAFTPGIIPADAGSTFQRFPKSDIWTDHPRGCEEHTVVLTRQTMVRGSSPRMRGARMKSSRLYGIRGIIPADAGSTRSWACCCPARQDHPRGCGEHISGHHGFSKLPGSSPRMRGARSDPWLLPHIPRIIPADAGSTTARNGVMGAFGDHPRGCGEHCSMQLNEALYTGSSPRMRGAPVTQQGVALRIGIIPADAGSTPSDHYPSSAPRDHPRGCGEHGLVSASRGLELGSSPRMRGARCRVRCREVQ